MSYQHHCGAGSEIPATSSQYTWRMSKLVPIGTVASVIRLTHIGNDFHVSHIDIGLVILKIRLIVDSSSRQHINRDE
jgi:hypothetical protein